MPVSKQLTLCSLFDGSGAFCLGALLAGIKPIESSEVEPFPILVTQKRLPDVKHYGDVSKLSGQTLEPVDIITFGSPCQDLSIAGKRAGIHDGQRSSLFFEAVRIIKEMREETDGKYPRYIVWENVMGALSSNGGGDFKAVLEAIIGVKEEGVEVPTDGAWLTEFSIRNTGAFPNAVQESTLSQILMDRVPEKYYLSPKACQGILRRASARGKELPEVLRKALERQAVGLTLEVETVEQETDQTKAESMS